MEVDCLFQQFFSYICIVEILMEKRLDIFNKLTDNTTAILDGGGQCWLTFGFHEMVKNYNKNVVCNFNLLLSIDFFSHIHLHQYPFLWKAYLLKVPRPYHDGLFYKQIIESSVTLIHIKSLILWNQHKYSFTPENVS